MNHKNQFYRDAEYTWRELAAQAVGQAVIEYIESNWTFEDIVQAGELRALQALEDVREALDDDSLDDPQCFYRIEAIIRALEKNGLGSLRHDLNFEKSNWRRRNEPHPNHTDRPGGGQPGRSPAHRAGQPLLRLRLLHPRR